MNQHRPRLPTAFAGILVSLVLAVSACGGGERATPTGGTSGASGSGETESGCATGTVRLGYFPNVTHAPALVGVKLGHFEEALGDSTLETSTFNAGPEMIEAMLAGALDLGFIGPNPAINGYAQSEGDLLRIVSGSTTGGAYLVVSESIQSPADLDGASLATPQLGNTQDVALRTWLADAGFQTDPSGGGDVSVIPQANADTLNAFKAGDIDGAWVPEPWATRLIQEGGGRVLVDERDLWPDGRYVTTHLVARRAFLETCPDLVRAIIRGEIAAIEFIGADSDEAKATTNAAIEELTQNALPQEVIDAAWPNLEFTVDPVAPSLQQSASDAQQVGLLDPVDLTSPGIYDLTILNQLRDAAGQPRVNGL